MIVVSMLFGLAAAVPLGAEYGYQNVDGPGSFASSRMADDRSSHECSGFVFSPGCLRSYMRRALPFLKICRRLSGPEEFTMKNSTGEIQPADNFAGNLRAVTDCIEAVCNVFLFKPYSFEEENQNTGRTKKMRHHQLMQMVFSMAFSLMSLLVGKAMSMSVMALMAALMNNKNGHGGHHHHHKDSVTYDIVQHPQVHYANTHSLEHVYDESNHHPVLYEQPRVIRRIHQKIYSK